MVKTTITDAKNSAQFTDFEELKKYLKGNNFTVVAVEKIAYTLGIHGCNGYLLRLQTNERHPIYAFTGRSLWMYNCDSPEIYNE
jgi:hypothetical protein